MTPVGGPHFRLSKQDPTYYHCDTSSVKCLNGGATGFPKIGMFAPRVGLSSGYTHVDHMSDLNG